LIVKTRMSYAMTTIISDSILKNALFKQLMASAFWIGIAIDSMEWELGVVLFILVMFRKVKDALLFVQILFVLAS